MGKGWALAASSLAVVFMAGCGNNYRPVVSAISPVGPAGQPTKYAVAISIPSTTTAGLLTFVDVSGDTVLSTPSIQLNPTYLAFNGSGSIGYTINAAGELDNFALSNPTALRTADIGRTTLTSGLTPVSVAAYSGTPGTILYIPQTGTGTGSVAALNASGPSLLQNLSVGLNPNYVVGADSAPRVYALSGTTTGTATAIETTNTLPSISSTITVGSTPIYGTMSADLSRAFIVNKGSGTVSVINVTQNALDSTTPVIPATGTLGTNPVWAQTVSSLNELVVLNAGNGTTQGTLSVIDVSLCSNVTTLPNQNCNTANPTDSTTFGTVLATIPVGVSPTMVAVLRDGSRAYVVNQSDSFHGCGTEGSVSVVNLSTNSVSSTVCGISTTAGTASQDATPLKIYGHPNTVAVTLSTPTGKVYITSSDSKYMTILRTDTDTVQTHITLQGLGVGLPTGNAPQSPGVLVTAQ